MGSNLHGLYAITDSTLMSDETLLSAVEAALEGGAALVQYRDKSRDHQQRLRQASALVQLCRRYRKPLLINDDVELARSCDADGVHLGQGDGSVEQARQRLGDHAIIGVTCHDRLELALRAEQQGANYVAFGAFFPSSTKPDAQTAPMHLLQEARQKLTIPVVAIGGISMDNAPQLIERGADMIAVIHSLFAAADIRSRARSFGQLF